MSIARKILVIVFSFMLAVQIANAQSSGWQVVKNGGTADLVTVYFTSSERGFVAGDNGYFAFTNDGGRSWIKENIYTTENINEIYFRNDDNGYLVAGRKMLMTGNGGRSWNEVRIFDPRDFNGLTPEFLSIRFADKKRGFIVGSLLNKNEEVVDSLVMRTENGGASWSRITVPFKRELFHLDFVNGLRGWIVGDKGMILVTSDGGNNWRVQRSGTDKALYNVDFRDSEDGYAVGGKGVILRTENGGENWQVVQTSFPQTFLRVDFADDKNGWIVGYDGTILRSSDKGKSWIKQELKTKNNLYGLFMSKKYGWSVGEKGLIVQYRR